MTTEWQHWLCSRTDNNIAVSCYAYIYSSKHIFGLCIILSCISSKKYSNLFWHILSLY